MNLKKRSANLIDNVKKANQNINNFAKLYKIAQTKTKIYQESLKIFKLQSEQAKTNLNNPPLKDKISEKNI